MTYPSSNLLSERKNEIKLSRPPKKIGVLVFSYNDFDNLAPQNKEW